MARTFTLGVLVTRCQQLLDLENQTDFASTSLLKGWISTAYAELQSILVASGLRYFESEQSIAAASLTADTYGGGYIALPAGYLSTIGVDYVVNATTNERRELDELMVQERGQFSGLAQGEAFAYALIGANLHLFPRPPTGQTYIHVYVPQPTDYSSSADGTSVDVVTPDGEDFLIWRVAVMAKEKEQDDTTTAERNLERARQRLEEWAALRSLNTPRRRIVAETVRRDEGDWWPRRGL